MKRHIAKILGVMISGLALAHIFAGNKRLAGKMNVEKGMTLARIPLALSLISAGFIRKDQKAARNALMATGTAYIGVAMAGLADNKLGGKLQRGLSGFDIAFHALAGAGALVAGLIPERPSR